MRNRRLIGPSLLLLVAAAGCQALHVYRPVGVLVRDAETKQPIATAEVYLSYPSVRDSLSPYNSSGVTREDGVARLRAAASGENGAQLKVVAANYLTEEKPLTAAEIEKVPPAHPFEKTELRPAAFVVEVYAGPRFSVELVVPDGYRGLVKTEVQARDDLPPTPGQRCFRGEVSPAGVARVVGPSLLRRVTVADYYARYASGEQFGGEMGPTKVGFRWLKAEGREQLFVVGTQPEYDALRRRLLPEEEKKVVRTSEGERGGGRGGRHHRGGQASSP